MIAYIVFKEFSISQGATKNCQKLRSEREINNEVVTQRSILTRMTSLKYVGLYFFMLNSVKRLILHEIKENEMFYD